MPITNYSTQEVYYSTKRQQFLIDQGVRQLTCGKWSELTPLAQYAFKVITHLDGMTTMPDLVYNSRDEQISLLQSVLLANETDADLGSDIKAFADDLPGTVTTKDFGRAGAMGKRADGVAPAKRVTGSLTALSGAQSMSYIERSVRAPSVVADADHFHRNRSENKTLAKQAKSKDQPRHALFQKRAKVSPRLL